MTEAQIEELFFEKITRFMPSLGQSFNAAAFRSVWLIHGLKEYFRSVRDLNRYFNNLIFSLPNIIGDVNLFDFLVLDAIKTFDTAAYNRMYGHMIEVFRKGIWQSTSLDTGFVSTYEQETTRALLDFLFVRQHSDDGDGNVKRLRDRDYFERYFALNSSKREVANEHLVHFFMKDTDKGIVLATALRTGKIVELLEKLADEDLAGSFILENRNIFRDFADFWKSRPDPIDIDSGALIVRAYFNLIRFFKDKHKATNAAIAELSLEKDKADRIGFMFKHFLVKDNDLLNLPDEVFRYIELYSDRLNENLLQYIKGHSNSEFFRISGDSANWIDNFFLIDLVEGDHESYLREFGERIYPKIIWFIVVNNLFEFKDGMPDRLIREDIKFFFPSDMLTEVLRVIKDTETGHLREKELKEIKFFAYLMSQ
ncbi:hypothetical protein [Pedobacter miscanthi]|uniref:hypothetical protein n=1 Tax=Pedobacter miscanthi TaxID=2259170 RepID=UPI0029301E70|nr:hypothetical protein [Pedobacter miscanthi]